MFVKLTMRSQAVAWSLMGSAKLDTNFIDLLLQFTQTVAAVKVKFCDVHILLTSAIIFSGNSFAKIKLLFEFMHLAIIGKTTFYSYQRHWVSPAVKKYYSGVQVRNVLVCTVLYSSFVLNCDVRLNLLKILRVRTWFCVEMEGETHLASVQSSAHIL